MSTKRVPWPREAHTAAKHRIYAEYLAKWFPILLSRDGYPSVTYAEGFSGPGVYADGSAGSPIIALSAVANLDPPLADSKVTRFVFIDNDERCVDLLKREMLRRFPSRPRPAGSISVDIRQGRCEEELEFRLDGMGAWHNPILAVLDSWGNAPVPYRLVRRLAQNPGSEIIVTFLPQHFIRFVSQLNTDADEIFGHDSTWRQVEKLPGQDKKRFILSQYRRSVERAGFRYLLDFELITRHDESLYLIFATNHRRGLEKMKESVWQVDRAYGVGFRDPRDNMQEALLDLHDPVLAPLQRILRSQMAAPGGVRVETLRDFALFHTVYREQHVIPALQHMLQRGEILADRARLTRSAKVRLTH